MSNTNKLVIELPQLVSELSQELSFAAKIILTMLRHMTTAQKRAAHFELDEAGVSGEGMTRYNERRDVLDRAAKFSAPQDAIVAAPTLDEQAAALADADWSASSHQRATEQAAAAIKVTNFGAGVPVCIECKHIETQRNSKFPKCGAPGAQRVDLVRGPISPYCESERKSHSAPCGQAGKLFERKSPLSAVREQVQSGSMAPSACSLSSFSNRNLDSVDNSAITVATASAETSGPNNDTHMARAVTSRS